MISIKNYEKRVNKLKYKAKKLGMKLYKAPINRFPGYAIRGWLIEDIKKAMVLAGDTEYLDLENAEIFIKEIEKKLIAKNKIKVEPQSEAARIKQLQRRAKKLNLRLYRSDRTDYNPIGPKGWILARLDTKEVIAGTDYFLDLDAAALVMEIIIDENAKTNAGEEKSEMILRADQLMRKAKRLKLKLYRPNDNYFHENDDIGWVLENDETLEVIAGKKRYLDLDGAARIMEHMEEKCETRYLFDTRLCRCRECHLKRVAEDIGYRITKSQGESWKYWDQGGYRLYHNTKIVLGRSYEATLDDIENYLFEQIENYYSKMNDDTHDNFIY